MSERDGQGGNHRGRRDAVLRIVRDSSTPVSIADVARTLGVHPNTARFHLTALVRSGQVQLVSSAQARPGRPAQLFRAVPGMDPAGPRRFRLLAHLLATSLADVPDVHARAVAAGRSWGAGLLADDSEGSRRRVDARRSALTPMHGVEADVEELVTLLDDLGFAPEREAGAAWIGLRSCPFLEVARPRTDVVCPVHLGLMQGALAAAGAAVTVEGLEAFVEPDLCVARLAMAQDAP